METIKEQEQQQQQQLELEERLTNLLKSANIDPLATPTSTSTTIGTTTSSTDSIGHRNVRHRRAQSSTLMSAMDITAESNTFTMLRHRPRSMSIIEHPSLLKYYPGSHLVQRKGIPVDDTGCFYLSLWLLPPRSIRAPLSKEIAQISLKYSKTCHSSAPFMPHVTIIGSIRCETQREMQQLGRQLQRGLAGSGHVPCRFGGGGAAPLPSSSASTSVSPASTASTSSSVDDETLQPSSKNNRRRCRAMYNDIPTNTNSHSGTKQTQQKQLVWSQSCIAIMERSEEYMNLLTKARDILQLPPGEWMFPGPACEPHYSKFYGKYEIPAAVAKEAVEEPPLHQHAIGNNYHHHHDDDDDDDDLNPPPDFVADQAALYLTTPGTLQGVAQWRQITLIDL